MSDKDHGLLVGIPDAHELEPEFLARHGIESREGLVHQQDRRVVNERAADRDPLLHAARQFTRETPLEPGKADKVEEVHGTRTRRRLVKPADLSRQQDIVEHAAPLQQHRLLEHDPHVARRARERHAVVEQEAARWADEPADQLEQRRLTAAGGADQRDEFVPPDREIDLRERGDPPTFRRVRFFQALDVDFVHHTTFRAGSGLRGERAGHLIVLRQSDIGLLPVGEYCQRKRCRMFGAPKAVHRIVAGALIASTILLRPSASNALDSVTLITDFAYNGAHAYFFDAVDRGYYRDAGLEVKIVRGQGSGDAIRQVGAGNALSALADVGTLRSARANDQIPVKLVAAVYRKPPHTILCREDSGLKKPKDLEGNAIATTAGAGTRFLFPAFAKAA